MGKAIRGKICHSVYQYAKANNKYTKYYDKSKELSYLQNWDVNNLCGWEMSQKLVVNTIKDTSRFNKDFIKNYDEGSHMKDIFLKLIFNTLKIYTITTMICHFYLKE